MPFPTLPPELLVDIFHLALPSIETVSAAQKRESNLTNLCLVSRQFRDIAQPLLWRMFRPKRNHCHLAASFPGLAKHVCILQTSGKVGNLGPVGRIFKHMPNLAEFRFSSIVFRNLVSLTIHEFRSNDLSDTPLLPTASFPSLKAVDTTSWKWTGRTGGLKLLEPEGLESQLDMLQVHVGLVDADGGDLWQRGVPVLLTFSQLSAHKMSELRFNKFRHFQLDACQAHEMAHYSARLQSFTLTLTTLSNIQSLSLPSHLHPSSDSFLGNALIELRDRILSTCASRKVDIIWRLNSKERVDDEGVSRDFWRYAKELKRKKAIEVEGGAAGSGNA
ncbi:hypothetical protein JCM8547_007037 [Rhodosporidiobolus lusitaniae]